jgi:hypothetical protein
LSDYGFGSNIQLMVCWTTGIAETRTAKTATGRILFVCAGVLPPVLTAVSAQKRQLAGLVNFRQFA